MNLPGWPRMMNPDMAAAYVGGDETLKMLNVNPKEKKKGKTRYDQRELDAALDTWDGHSDLRRRAS